MSLFSQSQPISFCIINGCGCGDSEYCLPYEQSDFLAFQFRRNKAIAASGVNLVTNGDFATGDLTGWSNSGNSFEQGWFYDSGHATATNANVKEFGQSVNLKAGKKYAISFDYEVYAPAKLQLVAYRSFQDIETEDYEVLAEIDGDSSGTYSDVLTPEADYVRFAFTHEAVSTPTAGTTIDNVSIEAYTATYTINITDCEGDIKATLTADQYEVFDEYVNVKAKFSDLGLADGQYFVCMEENVFANPDFVNSDLLYWEQDETGNEWNSNTSGQAIIGQATAIISGSEETATIYQEFCELEKDTEYELCVLVADGHSHDWRLIINGRDYGAGSFDGDSVCWTFTATEEINSIGIKVIGDGSADLSEVAFTNANLTANICSHCIDLAATHDCTKLLSWSDSCDNYGMNWGYFTAYLRVNAKLRNPRYAVTDEEQFINPFGNRQTLSAYVAERRELTIDNLPGHLWNALAFAVTTDYFKIDGISYAKATGDIDPDWRKSNTFVSNGIIEVFRNKQPNWKNYCFKKKSSLTGEDGCGCDLSDYYTKNQISTLLDDYYTKSELSSSGTSAVNWNNLINVPAYQILPAATDTYTLRGDGTSWVSSGVLRNDGNTIGINTAPGSAMFTNKGTGATSGTVNTMLLNAGGAELWKLQDDGGLHHKFADGSTALLIDTTTSANYNLFAFGGAVDTNANYRFLSVGNDRFWHTRWDTLSSGNAALLTREGTFTAQTLVAGSGSARGIRLTSDVLRISSGIISFSVTYDVFNAYKRGHIFKHFSTQELEDTDANNTRTVGIEDTIVAAGNKEYTALDIYPTIDQDGHTGITRGIWSNPILTDAHDFRHYEITGVDDEWGILQTGANVQNKFEGSLDAGTYAVAGTAGVSGSFTTTDGKTVTVVSGIITSIV